jgi:hypothetical protein
MGQIKHARRLFKIEHHLDQVAITLPLIRRGTCEEPVRLFQNKGLTE